MKECWRAQQVIVSVAKRRPRALPLSVLSSPWLHGGGGSSSSSSPAVRHMSIMDRYRKIRPAPEPSTRPWAKPAEFRDGRTGLPEEAQPTRGLTSEEGDVIEEQLRTAPRRPPVYARAPVPTEALFSKWDAPVQPDDPRSLKIGLAGPPNSGKSSLMNAFLNCPVSAVSPKVNTTREGVRGIKTVDETQMVFLDVPGIIPSHQRQYNRELVSKAWQGYQDCELCLLVIDVLKRPNQEVFDMVRRLAPREEIGDMEMRQRRQAVEEGRASPSWLPRPIPGTHSAHQNFVERPPVVLVLNKIDRVEEFRWVQEREKEFRAHGHFKKVFYISAKKKQGMWKLLDYLKSQCAPRPWTYPGDLITTLPYVEQVKHQINTHLFAWFNSDIPYKIEHQTIGWTPRLDGTLLVEHELIVQDSVVARMILGTRNLLIQRLRDQVSYKLKKMWGMPVEVFIWVRPLKQRISAKDRETAVRPTSA